MQITDPTKIEVGPEGIALFYDGKKHELTVEDVLNADDPVLLCQFVQLAVTHTQTQQMSELAEALNRMALALTQMATAGTDVDQEKIIETALGKLPDMMKSMGIPMPNVGK